MTQPACRLNEAHDLALAAAAKQVTAAAHGGRDGTRSSLRSVWPSLSRWALLGCALVLWAWGTAAGAAEPLPPEPAALTPIPNLAIQTLAISNTGASPAALVCARKGPTAPRPPAPVTEPTEVPSDDDVAQALQDARTAAPAHHLQALRGSPQGWRIAIWGDSHMAAAFFSDQMVRQLTGDSATGDAHVSSRFVHAGVGHGGVRGLVRKTCLSGDWGREMAYAHNAAAAAPGPGMTSLVAKRPGATLALDLRDAQGQARHTRLQLLHHGDGTGHTQLALSVDGEAETMVTLNEQAGPQALALSTSAPLSTLRIRVVAGAFRFQGLKLAEAARPAALLLDLFAYPGATVAGWERGDLGYLSSWFSDQTYDLALIAFGTNEGNDPRFNGARYRDMLTRAVGRFRQVFPQTQCVLIAPGDRGVRVVKRTSPPPAAKAAAQSSRPAKDKKQAPRQTRSRHPAASTPNSPTAKPNPVAPEVALLKYARIHQQIGQIQADVAAQHGCQAWSMQTAMGGVGSAYPWARKNPPLMAADLIHFTPAGYRELANTFMADFGLTVP